MRLLIKLVFALLAVAAGASGQQQEQQEEQAKALELILTAADRICKDVPLEQSATSLELSGKAKAELNAVVAKLVELGVEGAGSMKTSESQGVLQEDLAQALKNSADCKLAVFQNLSDKLIPSKSAPPTPQKKAANGITVAPADIRISAEPCKQRYSEAMRFNEHPNASLNPQVYDNMMRGVDACLRALDESFKGKHIAEPGWQCTWTGVKHTPAQRWVKLVCSGTEVTAVYRAAVAGYPGSAGESVRVRGEIVLRPRRDDTLNLEIGVLEPDISSASD